MKVSPQVSFSLKLAGVLAVAWFVYSSLLPLSQAGEAQGAAQQRRIAAACAQVAAGTASGPGFPSAVSCSEPSVGAKAVSVAAKVLFWTL